MKKLSKVLLAAALLMIIASPLSAAKLMNVTWQWLLNDPYVTSYRYQIDGEEVDGWTVVDGKTDTYVATGLDPYKDYTLYLQCTYDGVLWSDSATSTAYALLEYVEEAPAPEPVVEAPAPAPVVEEKKAETASFSVFGYTVNNSWIDGKFTSLVEKKGVVSEDDVRGFVLHEVEKYGDLLLANTSVEFVADGFVLTYPEEYANPSDYLAAYKADLEEYVTALFTPSSEPVKEEAPVAVEPVVEEKKAETASFSVFGYNVENSWIDGKFTSLTEKKGVVSEDDVRGFVLYEIAKYGDLLLANTSVEFVADGFVLTYPSAYADPSDYIAAYKSDLEEYVTALFAPSSEPVKEEAPVEVVVEEPAPVETPVVAEEPTVPAAPLEPVAVDVPAVEPVEEVTVSPKAKKVSNYSFRLSTAFGPEFGYYEGQDYVTLFPRIDIGADFRNIFSFGSFGLGTRLDLSVMFKPVNGTFIGHEFKYFLNGNNWAMDATVDAKLMAYLNLNSTTLYLGAGAGYSLASNTLCPLTHDTTTKVIGFNPAVIVSAVAGVDVRLGDTFSVGTEVAYRFFFQKEKKAHTLAANVVFGFNF